MVTNQLQVAVSKMKNVDQMQHFLGRLVFGGGFHLKVTNNEDVTVTA